MASAALVAVCCALLLCLSAPAAEARRRLHLDRNQGPLASKSAQGEPLVLEEEQGEVRIGRRGLVLLQVHDDPYDAGFAAKTSALLSTPKIYDISTTPEVPVAQVPYVATIFASGVFPGQQIELSILGSDEFVYTAPPCLVTPVAFPQGSGVCRQTIPGSPMAGAVDTLTATIKNSEGAILAKKATTVGPIASQGSREPVP